jgi:tetratricopeptide (TPR) repeat protein
VALRTASWPQVLDLLKASAPPAARPNLTFLAAQLANLAAGMHAIDVGDVVSASASSTTIDAALAQMTEQSTAVGQAAPSTSAPIAPPKSPVRPDALLPPILSSLSIMALELRGALRSAQGEPDEAAAAFEQAAKDEKALGYQEPPIYIRPVYESQGAAEMAAGNWTDARKAYEQALLERPRSGFGLYGIAMSSERTGDSSKAVQEYAAFLDAWKDADRTLPQVVHARAYLAAHRRTAPETTRRTVVTAEVGAYR